jgi:hypothetical protein
VSHERIRLLLIAVVLAGAVVAQASVRPDFSGSWALSLVRSQLDPRVAAGLQHGSLRVTQTATRLRFRRLFVTGGREDEDGYDLASDGVEVASTEGRFVRRSRLDWDGDILILRERISAPMGEATNTVHYRLIDGGRTLEARERFHGPRLQYENVWIFEKVVK